MSARIHNCPFCGPVIQEDGNSLCCPRCDRAPAGEASSTDARIKEAAIALAVATVASCDCNTKSHLPEMHSNLCTYASLRMAMARVDRIIARRAEAARLPDSPSVSSEPPHA